MDFYEFQDFRDYQLDFFDFHNLFDSLNNSNVFYDDYCFMKLICLVQNLKKLLSRYNFPDFQELT